MKKKKKEKVRKLPIKTTTITIDFIGHFLAFRRNQLGLTVEDLAKSAKIARVTLYKYEQGKITPSFEAMLSLCDVLNCSLQIKAK